MNLFILDKDPIVSAQKFYDKMGSKYAFKMLIELGQLICSAGFSDVYKTIPQGKELQEWIKENPHYTKLYFTELSRLCQGSSLKIRKETLNNIFNICHDINISSFYYECSEMGYEYIWDACFRYSKDYVCSIPSKTLLPINECIKQTELYLDWKKERLTKNESI